MFIKIHNELTRPDFKHIINFVATNSYKYCEKKIIVNRNSRIVLILD